MVPTGPRGHVHLKVNLALSDGRAVEGHGRVDPMGLQVASRAEGREPAPVKTVGLSVREELGVDCCHANQDKFWVEDPDGVEWEVYVLNHDLEDRGTGVASLAVVRTSCCAPA